MTAVEKYVELLDRILSGEIEPPKKYPTDEIAPVIEDWDLIFDITDENVEIGGYLEDVMAYELKFGIPYKEFLQKVHEMRTKILEIQKSTADCEREENLNDRN